MNPALLNLLNSSDTQVGHDLVSPGFHANPSFLSSEAKDSAALFDRRMLGHEYHPSLHPIETMDQGETQKYHFKVGGHRDPDGKLLPSSMFMVKPYYENLADWQYGHYPLSGWAEMAWHGILHAANLGHTAMNIHSFPYHDSALLGIELEHNLVPISAALRNSKLAWHPQRQLGKVYFPSNLKDDAARLGALDFLLNNQDRNLTNLLMNVSDGGQANALLAIDNGRSMQYMESNRFKASEANSDNLFHYLKAAPYTAINSDSIDAPIRSISGWWDKNKPAVVKEFHKHLAGIEHSELAHHIGNSFSDRVTALDNVVSDFKKHGATPYSDYFSHNCNGASVSAFNRATVKVRAWTPSDDPKPLELDSEEPEAYGASCPTCGDDYEEHT